MDDDKAIIAALRGMYELVHSDNPHDVPADAYSVMQCASVRDVQRALLSVDDEEEYSRLEDFYSRKMRDGDQDLHDRASRSNTEFRFLREHCGLSQGTLADMLAVSLSTVRRWEATDGEYSPSSQAWDTLDAYTKRILNNAKRVMDNYHQMAEALLPEEGDEDWHGPDDPALVHASIDKIVFYLFDNQEQYEREQERVFSLEPDDATPHERIRDAMNNLSRISTGSDGKPQLMDLDLILNEYVAHNGMLKDVRSYNEHNAIVRIAYTFATSGLLPYRINAVQVQGAPSTQQDTE